MKGREPMSRNSFVTGALILTVAGVIVKIMGSVNRIILSRLLGGEGIGLYQMAYPIYLLGLSLSSAGLPVAISVLVAEKAALGDRRGARRIFILSLGLLTTTGLFFSGLLLWGAKWLILFHIVRDERAYYAIIALAPAIFFVTVMSSFRGYFQGLQTMTPTALSQVAEQFIRIVVMLSLAFALLPKGIEYAAAGASFGAAPGALAGLIVLVLYDRWRKRFRAITAEQPKEWSFAASCQTLLRLIRLALPVSLAHIMMPIVASIDLILVPARLETAGYTVKQATELFGYLTGMAVALTNVPAILTGALASSLVPAVASSVALRQPEAIRRKLAAALSLSNAITIPSAVGLYLLAAPVSLMLYGTTHAGATVGILAIGIIFLGIHQVTTGVLQGMGKTLIPVLNLVCSAVLKIILNYYLTALPEVGILGAAWATVADFAAAALLNLYFIHLYSGYIFPFRRFASSLAASGLMGVGVLFIYHEMMMCVLDNTASCLTAILAAILIYAISFPCLGGIGRRDMERFFMNLSIRR